MANLVLPFDHSRCARVHTHGSNSLLVFLAVLSIGIHSVTGATTVLPTPDVQVRLLDGPDIHEGVLEYFSPLEHQWVSVCGDAIQKVDADVVCNDLGFHGGAAGIRNITHFVGDTNYTALVNVWCETNEGMSYDTFSDCALSGLAYGRRCGEMAAQITCLETRLYMGGNGGRVEVWSPPDNWGKVCSPEFGEDEQIVVCRELGYEYRSKTAYSANQFTDSGEPYSWGEVSCSGSEFKLAECSMDRPSQKGCPDGGDAFAICSNSELDEGLPQYLEVRLEDGPCETEGRLMVWDGAGAWGTVCQERITPQDAQVICRQLGFTSPSAEVVKCCNTYSPASARVEKIFGELNCTGDEDMIAHCSHAEPGSLAGCETLGHHDNDVGVRCHTCKIKNTSIGAIVGGVIAAIIIVIIIIVVLWYVCYRPSHTYQEKVNDKDDMEEGDAPPTTKEPMTENDLNADDLQETNMNDVEERIADEDD